MILDSYNICDNTYKIALSLFAKVILKSWKLILVFGKKFLEFIFGKVTNSTISDFEKKEMNNFWKSNFDNQFYTYTLPYISSYLL